MESSKSETRCPTTTTTTPDTGATSTAYQNSMTDDLPQWPELSPAFQSHQPRDELPLPQTPAPPPRPAQPINELRLPRLPAITQPLHPIISFQYPYGTISEQVPLYSLRDYDPYQNINRPPNVQSLRDYELQRTPTSIPPLQSVSNYDLPQTPSEFQPFQSMRDYELPRFVPEVDHTPPVTTFELPSTPTDFPSTREPCFFTQASPNFPPLQPLQPPHSIHTLPIVQSQSNPGAHSMPSPPMSLVALRSFDDLSSQAMSLDPFGPFNNCDDLRPMNTEPTDDAPTDTTERKNPGQSSDVPDPPVYDRPQLLSSDFSVLDQLNGHSSLLYDLYSIPIDDPRRRHLTFHAFSREELERVNNGYNLQSYYDVFQELTPDARDEMTIGSVVPRYRPPRSQFEAHHRRFDFATDPYNVVHPNCGENFRWTDDETTFLQIANLHVVGNPVAETGFSMFGDDMKCETSIWGLAPLREIVIKRVSHTYQEPATSEQVSYQSRSRLQPAYDKYRDTIRMGAIQFACNSGNFVDVRGLNLSGALENMYVDETIYLEFMNELRSSKNKHVMSAFVNVTLCALGVLDDPDCEPSALFLAEYVLIYCAIYPWTKHELIPLRRLFAETLIAAYHDTPETVNTWYLEKPKQDLPSSFFTWFSNCVMNMRKTLDKTKTERIRGSLQYAVLLSVLHQLYCSRGGSRGLKKALINTPGFLLCFIDCAFHPRLIHYTIEDSIFRRTSSDRFTKAKVVQFLSPDLLLINVFPDRPLDQCLLFKYLVTHLLTPAATDTSLRHVLLRVTASVLTIMRMMPLDWPDYFCDVDRRRQRRANGKINKRRKRVQVGVFCVCRKCIALKSLLLVLGTFDADLRYQWFELDEKESENAMSMVLFALFRSVIWAEFGCGTSVFPLSMYPGECDKIARFLKEWKRHALNVPAVLNVRSTAYWGSSILSIIKEKDEQYGAHRRIPSTFTRLPMTYIKQHCLPVTCIKCSKITTGSKGMRLCGGCKMASYCDVKCHDQGWLVGHRRVCSSVVKCLYGQEAYETLKAENEKAGEP